MVERAERLGVAIQTSHRLYEGGSDAELRTALVLLDGTIELLLFAGVREAMLWFPIYEQRAEMAEHLGQEVKVVSLPSPEQLNSFKKDTPWRLSKGAKDKVEREFVGKLDLLEFTDSISSPYRIALARLHKYRNDAYHNDRLRLQTLRTSVELDFYLTAQLLRTLLPSAHRIPHKNEVTRIATLLTIPEEVVQGGQPALQNALADFILDRLNLEKQGVQDVLAENIVDRVEAIEENLDYALDIVPHRHRLKRADIIRLVQEVKPLLSFEEMRKKQYRVTQKVIDSWRASAEQVRAADAPLDAFNIYAGIEERMSAFEDEAERLAIAADQELQHQIDVARGK